jgi:putative hydroxymethylpyrimidine transport system substrate-binding protein
MTRRTLTVLVALLAAAVLTACGGDGGDGGGATGPAGTATAAATPVDLVLDWYLNADHAGVVGAVDQGHFAREGVRVDTVVPTDPAASLKQVAAGKAEFALSYQPEVLIARSQGVPVQAVGAIVQRPLNAVIARTDRGVRRPRDLEGRTVGAAGVPSDRALLDTVVRADGGDPARVRVRNVGYNLSPALAAGKVDAVIGAYWNIEVPELERRGVPVTVLKLDEHGVPAYDELVVVTSDSLARERPELVRAFLAGLAGGQRWAADNPTRAAAALLDANPDLSAAVLPAQVALTAPLLSPPGGTPLAVDPAAWERFAAWMTEEGLLTEPVDAAAAVSDAYLPRG